MNVPSVALFILLFGLVGNSRCRNAVQQDILKNNILNQDGANIATRFNPPVGYERIPATKGSFAEFLKKLPLESHGSEVHLYNGQLKAYQDAHEAVIKLDIGNKDLQQCADAVIRLRAEYLYQRKEYSRIHFHFTNGFDARYSKWAAGYRIKVSGNKVNWIKTGKPDYSRNTFRAYLDIVFTFAGTLSLSKELKTVKLDSITPGDVFINGGSPGHAVIVTDVIENPVTKQRMFMLAQSYMPAQQIHILKNPSQRSFSPWYTLQADKNIVTPEWVFAPLCVKAIYRIMEYIYYTNRKTVSRFHRQGHWVRWQFGAVFNY